MNHKFVKNGLIAAAFMNIGGVLLFSRAFTNTSINEADPVVMSNFGLLMVIIWGCAYLGAATVSAQANIRWLAGAFVLEKVTYVVVWVRWISVNDLATVYSTDLFAGIYYTIYGLNDFVFMLFFMWLFVSLRAENGR